MVNGKLYRKKEEVTIGSTYDCKGYALTRGDKFYTGIEEQGCFDVNPNFAVFFDSVDSAMKLKKARKLENVECYLMQFTKKSIKVVGKANNNLVGVEENEF